MNRLLIWSDMPKSTQHEDDLYMAIADRWTDILGNWKRYYKDMLTVIMDIEVTHKQACPLDLEALLKADDENFVHDMAGIYKHLNRQTGELMGCFVPRFAKEEDK